MKMNKSIFGIIGIIALAAVIGLGLAGCKTDSDDAGSGGNGTFTATVKVQNSVYGSTITKLEFFNTDDSFNPTGSALKTVDGLNLVFNATSDDVAVPGITCLPGQFDAGEKQGRLYVKATSSDGKTCYGSTGVHEAKTDTILVSHVVD